MDGMDGMDGICGMENNIRVKAKKGGAMIGFGFRNSCEMGSEGRDGIEGEVNPEFVEACEQWPPQMNPCGQAKQMNEGGRRWDGRTWG
jgi:hypothetical protein